MGYISKKVAAYGQFVHVFPKSSYHHYHSILHIPLLWNIDRMKLWLRAAGRRAAAACHGWSTRGRSGRSAAPRISTEFTKDRNSNQRFLC